MGLISYNLWNQWRNGDIRYYQVKLGIVYYLVICEVYIYVFMVIYSYFDIQSYWVDIK